MTNSGENPLLDLVRGIYGADAPVPLHRPVFSGTERDDPGRLHRLQLCVLRRREGHRDGAPRGGLCRCALRRGRWVNGTNALQVALRLVGVQRDCEVLTQALTFVATCNAIAYLGARPVFVDVERATLGMSPDALRAFLEEFGERREEGCFNRRTGPSHRRLPAHAHLRPPLPHRRDRFAL